MAGAGDYSHLMWKEVERDLEARCRIFDVYKVRKNNFLGNAGNFYLLDTPEWVTVVPVIEHEDGSKSFVMVRQYRHGSNSVTLEFPAGVVEKGELPKDAGIRELKEETGYEAGRIDSIGSVNPNPAFMNNQTHVYLFRDLQLMHKQAFDEHEEVEVEIVDEETVIECMGTGEYSNGIMMIALGFYLRFR